MAECSWAVLCDYAFLDQGGKPCLIGIFDRIFARGVPTTHHQAVLVVKLEGAPNEEAQVRVEVVRPTGGVLTKVQGGTRLNQVGIAGLQLHLNNFPLPDFGRYQCNIYLNDVSSNSVSFILDPVTAAGKPS